MMHPARQARVDEASNDDNEGIDLANIPVDRDYVLPQATAGIAPEKASAIISQFDRKRRAAAIVVPTDDGKVRQQLRAMAQPITLFGEGPGDRRDRLRELLTQQAEAEDGLDGDVHMADVTADGSVAGEGGQGDQDEEFYTEGTAALLEARKAMARYSLPRAKRRVALQQAESTIPLRTHVKWRKGIKERLGQVELFGTQIAGDRPVSQVKFAPDGQSMAAGNWSGGIRLLSVPNMDEKRTLRGHTDRVGGISWYPSADSALDSSSSTVKLASGGGEGNINLWSLDQDTPLATLSGHSARICRVEFHPSGQYLASASYDTTWRLWDVAAQTELLLQEGHSREVYTVSFNTDGNLLASGGLDGIGRVWDLRTGRTVMILDKHIKDIYALDWSSDGHRVLSGSADGFVRCWDLRTVREAGVIGANQGGVTDLKWFKGADCFDALLSAPGDAPTNGTNERTDASASLQLQPKKTGTFVVSGGFDKNVQILSADDWSVIKTLSGHGGNVLGVDISRDARWVASCGHDRTVKLWARDDMEAL